MADNKPACVINKTEKKINMAGTAFEYKNLIVHGITMKETKEVFDEEWKKEK